MRQSLTKVFSLYTSMLTLLLALLCASGTWAQPAIDPAEPWNWPDDYVVEQVNQVRAGRDLTPR
jgi:hypothetical protein